MSFLVYSSFAELCQKYAGQLNTGLERKPEQYKWIKMGQAAPRSIRIQDSMEDRVKFALPLTDCAQDEANNYCEGDTSQRLYQTMEWRQNKITVKGFEFSDENVCDDSQLATYLSTEAWAQLRQRITNLIDKVDRAVFEELKNGYIKDSISGVSQIILGGLSQDGTPYTHTAWNAKVNAWARANFAAANDWMWVSGQDALEYQSRSGVAEAAPNGIAFSLNVEPKKAYHVQEGSYFFMQKAALKAGFYESDGILSLDAVFSRLNATSMDGREKMVFRILEPNSGVIVHLIVTHKSGCDDEYSKWVITPMVEYQLFVPQNTGGCTYPGPHIYRYDICGIPEPACQSFTPAYAAPRLCLTPSAVSGCASAAYGSIVSIAGGAVSGTGSVLALLGADVSTVMGKSIAINAALSGVANGGSVIINGAGNLEYQGSALVVGQTYTITLACGGSFTFVLGECVDVLQPTNLVLPAVVTKFASLDFTQDASTANDSIGKIVFSGGLPDLIVGLPMADVTGIQAAINAYFVTNGLQGVISYQYVDAPNGSQAIANFIAVTNAPVSHVESEVNGTSPIITNFA